MQPPKPLQDLLSREMDRKEFLAYMGTAALAVVGISGAFKALIESTVRPIGVAKGYGSGSYGGPRRTAPARHQLTN